MCFNASLVQTAEIMAVEFNAYIDDSLIEPVYFSSAFSLPTWPVLKDIASERFSPLQWGLVPSWVKNYESARDLRFKTINARIESIHEKASFRFASDNKRCAIPMDGWFEWKEVRGKKYPYYIHRQDKKPFLIAGLWETWVDPEKDEEIETFSIITTSALGICAQVHNTKERMPFVLSKNHKDLWLNKDLSFGEIRNEIQPQWKELTAHPVSKLVSSTKENRNIPEIRNKVEEPPTQLEFF